MKSSQIIAQRLVGIGIYAMISSIVGFAVISGILFYNIIEEDFAFLGVLIGGFLGFSVGWEIHMIFMALARIVLNTERSAVACENNHQADK